MPLNTSGPISLAESTAGQSIAVETGLPSTGTLVTGTVDLRMFVISFVSDGTRLLEASRTTAIAI